MFGRHRLAFGWVAMLIGLGAVPAAGGERPLVAPEPIPPEYCVRQVQGWTVLVHRRLLEQHAQATARALELLEEQLRFVVRHVPPRAVRRLKRVRLWFSPPYPNTQPKAEYHSHPAWLRQHGRPEAMARGVEFTNVFIFAREVKRMPVFVLHELAHAYHHQVLGWSHPDIQAAYQAAVSSGRYRQVLRNDGRIVRAYALTNPQEYFAELTEAFFGRNDFFPFDRRQLEQYDPRAYRLLARLWGVVAEEENLAVRHEPIRLHPQNPHYFLWRGKPTVLVTAGEHYGAVINRAFDYRAYLQELSRWGFNHTRVFSGVYRELPSSFRITDNPLAPKPQDYLCPWPRSNQPGAADGGNRFDLERFDPAYFDRLRAFLREASRRGVVVELVLFCPFYRDDVWNISPLNHRNNVNGVGRCPRTEVYTLKHPRMLRVHLAVTEQIVRAVNEFDNLYFEVCNEPYFAGVTDAWQRRIIRQIVETERRLPRRHLISLNVANYAKQVGNPPPEVSIFNFHYCVPPVTVEMNYGLNKVIGENETGFRGRADILYRTEAWDFLLAGGGLFNHLDYSFSTRHPRGTLRDYRSPGGGSPELRQQLSVLKRFLESFDFLRMKPDRHSVQSAEPKLTHYVLSEPGRQYAAYFHVPLPRRPKRVEDHLRRGIKLRVRLALPQGNYRVEWISPLTGRQLAAQVLKHTGGACELRSPQFDNDVALRISAEATGN